MAEPDLSVVIPTFRRERQLVEAIASALRQPKVSVEVIVIDDSADGSADAAVASIGDGRVRYVRRTVPSGGVPALGRNEGGALARGRYVHFLDDDDRLVDGASYALVSALDAAPNAGVAFGIVRPFGLDADVLRAQEAYFSSAADRLRRTSSRMSLVSGMLFDTTPLVNSACMIRRECIGRVGGYATDIPRCEDVDFYLRAIRRCGFVFVDRVVVEYRTGASSLMHDTPHDSTLLRDSYRRIYGNYRREYGGAELFGLRLLAQWRKLRRRLGAHHRTAPSVAGRAPSLAD